MNVFNHSGAQGDIIYSLPTIKRLGGGMLKINAKESIVDNLRPLLLMQPYIDHVVGMEYTGAITHDLDKFRLMPDLHREHLVLSHMRAFGVDETDWTEPWLSITYSPFGQYDYAVANMTPRYPAVGFDWKREIAAMESEHSQVAFIGEEKDNILGLKWAKCEDARELAEFISGSKVFIGNPSLALAIAEGLGHPYRMVRGDGLTNCDMGTLNETILNP